jgi:hypothetical protein
MNHPLRLIGWLGHRQINVGLGQTTPKPWGVVSATPKIPKEVVEPPPLNKFGSGRTTLATWSGYPFTLFLFLKKNYFWLFSSIEV